jgi:xylulokinase
MQAGILCVDIGSSSLKAAIIGVNGQEHAHSYQPLPQLPQAYGEFDPKIWYHAFCSACTELLVQYPNRPQAIIISGHGPSLVPIDALGRVSAPLISWSGPRGTTLAGASSLFLPKIADWQTSNPKTSQQTQYLIPCPDYLAGMLCGVWQATIPHNAYAPWYWNHQQVELYGINSDWLLPLSPMGKTMGELVDPKLIGLGLSKGIPIYSGGADFLMSLLGTACLRPGLVCDRAGSSEGVNLCIKERWEGQGLRTLPGVVPGIWNLAALIPASGMLFEWFRRVTGQDHVPYITMLNAIEQSIPHASGPLFFPDPAGHGTFSSGAFIGLETSHGPVDLSRAVVESLAFQVRRAKEHMAQSGHHFEIVRMCGGQSRNPAWCQIKADITGLIIECPQVSDAELLGGAVLVACDQGYYPNLEIAANEMVKIDRVYEPRLIRQHIYEQRFAQWLQILKQVPTGLD